MRKAHLKVLSVVALAVVLSLRCLGVPAAPIALAVEGALTVTLYDEPCEVGAVTNLPNRVTWNEGKDFFEGCFGLSNGIVGAYFDDKTVGMWPARLFIPVQGI